MNQVVEKIISRHSIRKFEERQIEKDVLEEILLAGLYAPSAGNNQQSKIVVSQDKEVNLTLGKLSRFVQFKDGEPKGKLDTISADQPSIRDGRIIRL